MLLFEDETARCERGKGEGAGRSQGLGQAEWVRYCRFGAGSGLVMADPMKLAR